MKYQLSSRLSPAAKKALLRGEPGKVVAAVLDLTATAQLDQLSKALESLGGKVRSTLSETHQITVEVPTGRLAELAEVEGIAHVDVATSYGLPSPPLPSATAPSEESEEE